jgi:polysaccharide pyruvyl transferase WcaK-like protein
MISPAHPATIVHIGAFDLASYGDQIFPLVAAHELSRRLGEVELLPFAPMGSTGGGASWALGPWSPERAAQIARRASLVLCGGGEMVHGDGLVYAPFYGIDPADAAALAIDRWFVEVLGPAEADCPVVWNAPGVPADLDPDTAARVRTALAGRAVVAVRDEPSRRRLVEAGVDRPVEVVPDSALLLPRVLPPADLADVRDKMRAEGWYPADGPVVVVQGNHTMSGLAPDLARALREHAPDARLVTVAVSPCHDDGAFAATLAGAAGEPTWTVPDDAPLEAVAAAIAGADCFLGVSLHGAITARAYGRPHVTLDPFGQAKLAGFADLVGGEVARVADVASAAAAVRDRLAGAPQAAGLEALEARIDAHFDRVADLARQQAGSRPVEPVGWDDSATPLHLTLRRPPRPLAPVPPDHVPGLRRPDVAPSADDLRRTVERALAARTTQRGEAADEHRELERLRGENHDLRGALAHLEGTQRHADALGETVARLTAELEAVAAERAALAAAVDGARASRIYRLTGRPAALRVRDDAVPNGA